MQSKYSYKFLLISAFLIQLLLREIAGDLNSADEQRDELIVELPNGKVRGRDNEFYYSYESMPYAQPPIGPLRFESPAPYTQKWASVFDATRPPVQCMQWDQYTDGDDKLLGVEDCLTINVYKPKASVNASTQAEQLPVIVLIHGGAFMFGSAQANGHEHFMRSGRVLVVKMSYRLGPLGFLSTEDTIIPGNFGLKDQRLALQWTRQNIARFGGDPERMLLLGFSSGSAAVHLHMLQANFTNFAKAAASFSGTALNPWVIVPNPRARAFELAKNLGCPQLNSSQAIKSCLQEKSAEDIVRGVRNFLVFAYNPFTTFGPVIEDATVEDAFLTRKPADYIAAGDFAQVPWLVSYSAQDGGYNAGELLQKFPRRDELIEELNERWFDLAPYVLFFKDQIDSIEGLDEYSLALKQRYLGDKEFSVANYRDVQRMYTDVLFRNGVEKAVRDHRHFGKSPVYAYVYDNPSDGVGIGPILAKRSDIDMGTTHGDDFFLIFSGKWRADKIRPDEQVISRKFIKMLEDFVKDGKLAFGSCEFIDNVGQDELQILHITKDGCENKHGHEFPSF